MNLPKYVAYSFLKIKNLEVNAPTITYNVLAIIGLLFQTIGTLFLSLESIGIQRFSNAYKVLYKISVWSKKSYLRMSIVILPFLTPLILGVFRGSKLMLALSFPSLIFVAALSSLIDSPKLYEALILRKAQEQKIGPIGFLITMWGTLLQLISVIWQMA